MAHDLWDMFYGSVEVGVLGGSQDWALARCLWLAIKCVASSRRSATQCVDRRRRTIAGVLEHTHAFVANVTYNVYV